MVRFRVNAREKRLFLGLWHRTAASVHESPIFSRDFLAVAARLIPQQELERAQLAEDASGALRRR
ncbi:MAG: hypothetical protein AAF664_22140 [Planctomycetota bacterium]